MFWRRVYYWNVEKTLYLYVCAADRIADHCFTSQSIQPSSSQMVFLLSSKDTKFSWSRATPWVPCKKHESNSVWGFHNNILLVCVVKGNLTPLTGRSACQQSVSSRLSALSGSLPTRSSICVRDASTSDFPYQTGSRVSVKRGTVRSAIGSVNPQKGKSPQERSSWQPR